MVQSVQGVNANAHPVPRGAEGLGGAPPGAAPDPDLWPQVN